MSRRRARACSISLDDVQDRRLLPVDKSMALNIEKRAAEEEEAKLVMQGLPDDEVSFEYCGNGDHLQSEVYWRLLSKQLVTLASASGHKDQVRCFVN